tara:strand:+ start:369 stop:524 length:156 start_codon:yes stop_codon:yes gene_type:complete
MSDQEIENEKNRIRFQEKTLDNQADAIARQSLNIELLYKRLAAEKKEKDKP